MKDKKQNAFLGQLLRPYGLRLFWLSALTVLQSVLQVSMALLFRFVIDAAIAGNGRLAFWAGLLVLDMVLQLGVYALSSWYSSSTTDRLAASLRSSLLRSAVYSADSRLQEFHSGELLSRGIEDVHAVCDGVIYAMPQLIGQVTRLVVAFVAVVLISPSVAAVLAVSGTVVVLLISALRPALKAKQRKVRETEDDVMSTMQEDLQRLELIQSLQTQEQSVKRFDRRLHTALKAKLGRRVWSVSAHSVLSAASLMGTGALLLWGASKVAAGLLSYGSLASMLQLLAQFRGPVLGLSGIWTRFAAVEVASERLAVLLEVSEQPATETVDTPKAVVFENVTFRYPGDEMAVVENFSLRLPMDKWISLSGMSGRGKTTLFKLILGLYTPQQGRVYLETEHAEVTCSPATRHLFAYVPQDYALFSGTVLENLLLVAPDATEEQRRDALIAACADYIFGLTDGENTHVGENNTGLSKGQLQRLAIARAILMQRQILLLDECTSALDADTENQVLQNLHRLCPHAILVTHRPEALETLPGVSPILMEE